MIFHHLSKCVNMTRVPAILLLLLAPTLPRAVSAQTAPPAPAFDVAYRAWDAVTDIARHNGDKGLGGECARTFRPFVIPGLRRQTREDQDVAGVACVATARSLCTNARLQRTADIARKCVEFN